MNLRLIPLFLLLLIGFSCNKLTTQNQIIPVVFKGIREVETSSKGTAIVLWDRPRGGSVAGFQVYVQDLSTTAPVALQLQSDDDAGAPVILTDANDSSAPVTLGKLVQIVEAERNSYEIPVLLPGRYALQVKAIDAQGAIEGNTKIAIIKVDSTLGYPGIESAEIDGTDILLKWPALASTLTSRNVIYTVYEGPTFEAAKAITEQTSLRLSLLGQREGSVLYYGVRSTDAKGRTDRNIKTLSVTVPSVSVDYQGCSAAEARGSDRIQISYAWPLEDFQIMKIYRDGNLIASSRDKGVTEFLDLGLSEGEKYNYSCVAVQGDRILIGKKLLSLTTLSSNPPTFRGVTGVDMKSPHSALVKWGVSSGVPADSYWVYSSVGTSLDWSAEPIQKVGADRLDFLIENLGDDLNYTFGVRACSIQSICDFNEISLTAVTADDGAPRTSGASALLVADGQLKITAPWSHPDGGISKRLVYLKTNGTVPTSTTGMTLVATVPVANKASPPTLLAYGPIADNTNYHVLVIDQDEGNRKNTGGAVRSLFSGDTTRPIFAGQTSLVAGTTGLEETTLRARFLAIETEPGSTIGASHYVAFVAAGNTNACALTTPYQIFPAANFAANVEGTAVITGLSPLTNYSVCIKARDAAGNLSSNTITSTRSTLDKTAPAFDGLQSISYDKLTGELVLGWNPSSASDLYEYSIKLWKNDPDPTGVPSLVLKRSSTIATTGTRITSASYALQSLEDVYALVSACDNAASVAGGAQNCSVHSYASATKLTLADIDPPAGFLGVEAEPNLGATTEGEIIVRWIAPASWSDYKGFAVYYVDPATNALDLARDCACSGDNCPNQITECTLSSLVPYQTYRFHVRAYDAVGNMTILDPLINSTSKRVLDATPPSFASALQLAFADAKIDLSWAPATDNQSTVEPGVELFYEVYRKRTTTFSNPTNPSADPQAAMMARTSQVSGRIWTDLGDDFISGDTYYYTVCAVDSSDNRSCDGNVKSYVIPDLVPPVISSFTSNKTDDAHEWNLSWVASDSVTTGPNLLYKIYAKQSLLADGVASTSDTVVFIQTGNTSYNNVRGPINTDVYIHYLLVVEDADGNRASRSLTVYSQNLITLTRIRSTEGLTAGGTMVVLVGDGFKPNIGVKIGNSDCQTITRYSRKHLVCWTPPGTSGTYNVRVTNPDGSSALLANAYSYCSGSGCIKTCNKPSSWSTPFAAGTGTEASPYLICNAAHLNAIRTVTFGKSYQMGENIDLLGVTMAPLHNSDGGTREFRGVFEGDDFAISNWTYNNINADGVGLFGIINRSSMKNLGLINFNVTGRDYVGALAGGSAVGTNYISEYFSWNNTISGIFVTGNVVGSGTRIGGLIGHSGGILSEIMAFTNVSGAWVVGGVFGRKYDGAIDIEHQGTVTATGTGTECRVGGVTGEWSSYNFLILNMKNYGTVTCTDQANVNSGRTGGIIGRHDGGTLENATNYSIVTGRDFAGGITGSTNSATMTNLVNHGAVNGHGSVGGITGQGYLQTFLTGAVNNGAVVASGWAIGGVAGSYFGSSSTKSFVKNASNKGSVTAAGGQVGGVIGYTEYGNVEDSVNSAKIEGLGNTGGIVGHGNGTAITGSSSTGNIKSTLNEGTGGILGLGYSNLGISTVSKSQASGTIDGRENTGGVAGLLYGRISEAEYSGDVTGLGGVGGIVGRMDPGTSPIRFLVELSKAQGTVTGETRCGGIAGEIKDHTDFKRNSNVSEINCVSRAGGSIGHVNGNNILIQQSSSRGAVYGNTLIGGFIGSLYRDSTQFVIVEDSYSRSDVKGNESVGGFAGVSGAVLRRVYSSARVLPDSTNSNLGGLIGLQHLTGSIPDAYWDVTRSTQSSSPLGEGRTTSQMLGGTNYPNFDQAVWSFNAVDYPKLLWETVP